MRRSAFTLLEVLLALAIAVLLLSALYVAVNTQLRQSQSAREVVEHSTLVRTLLGRISADIRASLGPVEPDRSQQAASTTTPTTGTTTPTTSTSTTTSSSLLGAVQFNLGVQGDAGRLTLYVSRVHRDPRFLPEMSTPDALAPSSDLRRITYWLVGGPNAPLGLARQVVRLVTSEDLMASVPPDVADEASYVFAEEVRGLSFSYFDGTDWRDSWDGTAVGADGSTPMGPPVAIAVILEVAGGRGANVIGEGGVKRYRQVVAIPTANGATPQTTTGQ